MITGEEQWLSVADLFSAAALGGDWHAALNALADACGAERGELIGVGADRAVPFNWMTRFDPAGLQEFVVLRGGDPQINPRVWMGLRAPILEAWHDVQCSNDAELRRNFVYADYCRRYEIPYGSQTTLLRDDGMLIGLAVLRSEARGVPQAEDRRAFEVLAPQVRAAVRTQMALEGQGAALAAGALETLGIAAFVCDGSGRVRALTPAAEESLGRGVVRLRQGRLGAARDEDTRALEVALAAAVRGLAAPGDRPLRTLVLRDPEAPLSVEVVDVVTLPARPFAFGFEPRALVTVRGARREDPNLSEVLKLAFALTPAEADIAVRLADGESREAIAQARGASVETVRSQVKSLFGKLGVSRAGELSARLTRLR